MRTFKLKVKLDPAKHNVPHEVAKKDPNGYTCGCIVSQAVNDALKDTVGKRFRRWKLAYSDTGCWSTTINVLDKNGERREYSATLPQSFADARETYDNNRGVPPAGQAPIMGATATLTFEPA